MVNRFNCVPEPYLFQGGHASEYEVFVGRSGTWCTRHISSNQAIQSVQPGSNVTEPMLQLANLGLGLLNFGIGIYNTYQTRKVRQDIAQQTTVIKTGFDNISRVLHAQHRMLELLATSQNDLRECLEILRQEMQSGYQNVVKEIQDAEARRRREEFEIRTFKLFKAYERFGGVLPDLVEAERLIERAEELEAWLQSQLNQTSNGSLERFPLFVVLCFSIRAKVDAFQAQGGAYTHLAIKELTTLRNQLQEEVYQLCSGQSLYSLGVEFPEVLGQYVLLNRSLGKGIEILNREISRDSSAENSTSENVLEELFKQEEVIWDDGLDNLREIFSPSHAQAVGQPSEHSIQNEHGGAVKINGKTKVRLNTLSDYEWYVRFAGEDRETFNIR